MTVKGRLLAIKMAEKEKKNPKFFEEIKVVAKIRKSNLGKNDNKQ